MGYAVTEVNIANVKRAIWEACTGLYISAVTSPGGTYDTIFESDVDLSNIDELKCSWDNQTTLYLKCTIGGVQKFENAGNDWQTETINTSGISGVTTIKLELKDTFGPETLLGLTMWASKGS